MDEEFDYYFEKLEFDFELSLKLEEEKEIMYENNEFIREEK
ncbi:MAG: hypothetical protein ACXVPU_16445 [Bacteroidia bacterium]